MAKITLTKDKTGGGGGGVTNVTATSPITSSGGTTPDISTSMNTNKLIGRSTVGVGVMEEISVGSGLALSGSTLIASSGGGSSVSYYLNGGTNQGTFVGNTYYQMSKTAVIGVGADFTLVSNGYIASFITDFGDPALLNIPIGNWNFEMYFSASSSGGNPNFYIELYKYDGAIFTLIASSASTPEGITNGTAIDLYTTALAIPTNTLSVSDRLAIRVYVNNSNRAITLHTQDSHLCQIVTTFTTGITALNGLTAQVQTLETATTGTDFEISSSGSKHTFKLPNASASARGVVSTGAQTLAGTKTFSSSPVLDSETASRIAILDESKNIKGADTTIYPSLTELTYVKGVTSAIQTQINNITGATRYYLLASNFSLTTAVETDIAGYAATVEANSYYDVDISLYTGLAGGSTGIKFGFKYPASSNYRISEIGRSSAATAMVTFGSAYTADTGLMALSYNTAAQASGQVMMRAVLVTGVNAGTFQMTMASASGAQTSTIFKNSLMILTKFTPQP